MKNLTLTRSCCLEENVVGHQCDNAAKLLIFSSQTAPTDSMPIGTSTINPPNSTNMTQHQQRIIFPVEQSFLVRYSAQQQ